MPPYLLVVESDPELQKRIVQTLREASYELATETEGAWAKRSFLIRAPDGVVLDTSLPDGSGFAVAEAMRRDPDTSNVPIFFVASRYGGAHHRSEARRRYSPAEYLNLPLDCDTLLARVLERVPPRSPSANPPLPFYPEGPIPDSAQRRERREVEREAKALTGRASELKGTLAREPFARILQRIYGGKMSGALLLASGPVKKVVYVRLGYPVCVRSNVLSECLGHVLRARRLIGPEVLAASIERMKSEKRHQGEILVEMGALSPHNLERALLAQMEAKLYDIFSWKSGNFRFVGGRDAPDQPVVLEKPPSALILEGIRRHYDLERQEQVLAPFINSYPTPNTDPLQRLQDISTDPAERHFIESLDGSRRLEAILEAPPIALGEARLLLVAMAEAGMVVPSRGPARRAEESRTNDLPEDPELRPPERRSRDELEAFYQGMLLLNHFDVLGVSEDASNAEIARAYETRARDFHPDRFRHRSEEMRQLAERIFGHLGSAYAVLGDGSRRKRYSAKLGKVGKVGKKGKVGKVGKKEEPVVIPHSPPAAAEQTYYAGVEHLRNRDYKEAAACFQQAIRLAPGQASYHGALGWAIYRGSPADPAGIVAGLNALRRAVELDPDDPWVHVSLGRFFAETGRLEDAIEEFEIGLRLNPGLTDIQQEIQRLKGEA